MNISQNSLLAGDWAAVKSGWGFESDLGTVIFMIIVFGIILFFLLWFQLVQIRGRLPFKYI